MTHRPDFRIEPPAPDYVRAGPDLYAELRRSGFRPPFGHGLMALIADIRANPWLAVVIASLAFAAGMLAVLVPAIALAWVVR